MVWANPITLSLTVEVDLGCDNIFVLAISVIVAYLLSFFQYVSHVLHILISSLSPCGRLHAETHVDYCRGADLFDMGRTE